MTKEKKNEVGDSSAGGMPGSMAGADDDLELNLLRVEGGGRGDTGNGGDLLARAEKGQHVAPYIQKILGGEKDSS